MIMIMPGSRTLYFNLKGHPGMQQLEAPGRPPPHDDRQDLPGWASESTGATCAGAWSLGRACQ
jgi:hypothetical protein